MVQSLINGIWDSKQWGYKMVEILKNKHCKMQCDATIRKICGCRSTNLITHRYMVVLSTPLKNISQLGWLFPIYGKIKNVPNHQPGYMVVSTHLRIWVTWAHHPRYDWTKHNLFGGFLSHRVPPVIIHFSGICPYEPTILEYPHLWKPPFGTTSQNTTA